MEFRIELPNGVGFDFTNMLGEQRLDVAYVEEKLNTDGVQLLKQ